MLLDKSSTVLARSMKKMQCVIVVAVSTCLWISYGLAGHDAYAREVGQEKDTVGEEDEEDGNVPYVCGTVLVNQEQNRKRESELGIPIEGTGKYSPLRIENEMLRRMPLTPNATISDKIQFVSLFWRGSSAIQFSKSAEQEMLKKIDELGAASIAHKKLYDELYDVSSVAAMDRALKWGGEEFALGYYERYCDEQLSKLDEPENHVDILSRWSFRAWCDQQESNDLLEKTSQVCPWWQPAAESTYATARYAAYKVYIADGGKREMELREAAFRELDDCIGAVERGEKAADLVLCMLTFMAWTLTNEEAADLKIRISKAAASSSPSISRGYVSESHP